MHGKPIRRTRSLFLLLLITALTALVVPSGTANAHNSSAKHPKPAPTPTTSVLASTGERSVGSTVGPDGALYLAQGGVGTIVRVDRQTGQVTTFASGLPVPNGPPTGGVMDVAFLHGTAYALVTLVSPDVGGTSADGIYRIDGPTQSTLVADIGAFSLANPPVPPFFVPSGVLYAMQAYRGGFLVTDGHHNRVLRVSLEGDISEAIAFGNIVPLGLALKGRKIYVSQGGPVPHLPADGKVVSFTTRTPMARDVAAGAPLVVDVEFGRSGQLYALSQGVFTPGNEEGSPANPNTGALLRVNRDGTMTPIVSELNQPTSLDIVGKTAYVTTLGGDVVKISGLSRSKHAKHHKHHGQHSGHHGRY